MKRDSRKKQVEEKAVERDANGRWAKGQSGNPRGLGRKLPDEVVEQFIAGTPHAIKKLFQLMGSADPSIRLRAVIYFLEKALGRNWQAFLSDDTDDNASLVVKVLRATNKTQGVKPEDEEDDDYG